MMSKQKCELECIAVGFIFGMTLAAPVFYWIGTNAVGTPASSQIINLERMVAERDDAIERLRTALTEALEVGSHLMSAASYERARLLVPNVDSTTP